MAKSKKQLAKEIKDHNSTIAAGNDVIRLSKARVQNEVAQRDRKVAELTSKELHGRATYKRRPSHRRPVRPSQAFRRA